MLCPNKTGADISDPSRKESLTPWPKHGKTLDDMKTFDDMIVEECGCK